MDQENDTADGPSVIRRRSPLESLRQVETERRKSQDEQQIRLVEQLAQWLADQCLLISRVHTPSV